MSPQSPSTRPLEAFPSLFGGSTTELLNIDAASFAPIIVLLACVLWLGFTFAIAYHWLRYAHRSWLAVPALAAHVFISGALILYAISGLV